MDSKEMKKTVNELMQINHIEKIALKELSLKKKIGEGGQAKVYKGIYEGEIVAVKVLEEVDWKCLAHEIVITANLLHPTIPKFYGIVLEDKVLSMVYAYIQGKTLDEIKHKELSDEKRHEIIKSLASVLEYIHSNKFIHRDLKPENLMLDSEGKLHLIDFGIAKVLTNNENTKTRAKGTLHYLAPESLVVDELDSEEQIISTISPAVDVWAYGCIVSWLYSGHLPWTPKYRDNSTIIQGALMQKKAFPIPENIKNPEILKLIAMCTRIKVSERWDMKQIREYVESKL